MPDARLGHVPVWLSQRQTGRGAAGDTPSAPLNVTSITKDAGATVSFYAPAFGTGITSYTVTPYIGASPQTPTTVNVGSLGSLSDSSGGTALQANVTGLTNSTDYTFTVKATNVAGTGPESTASGVNTPLANLVFGDHFNGPAGGPIDPEWWVYTRCGYLAQNEVQYYLPAQTQLDGSGNLKLTATHTSYTGPSYPSAGGGNVTQAWRSGAVQSNSRTYAPTGSNRMTFEVRQQICSDAGNGFWPGLFWLEGQSNLTSWKTDPDQGGWDNAGHAEVDVAEFFQSSNSTYGSNILGSNWHTNSINAGVDLSAAMHIYQAVWNPSTSMTFFRDGSQTAQVTADIPSKTACQYFMLIYLQMLAGGPTTTESCLIDYVRVFDAP